MREELLGPANLVNKPPIKENMLLGEGAIVSSLDGVDLDREWRPYVSSL